MGGAAWRAARVDRAERAMIYEQNPIAERLESWQGWLPIEFHFRHGPPSVEWCHFGGARLCDPFFVDSVHRCLAQPFNHLFRRNTSLETLAMLHEARPGLMPSGLIFHESRCGSTLVAQMLSSLPDAVVLSEPEPLNSVLSARWKVPDVGNDDCIQWMRWMTSALGHPNHGEKHLFIKLDSWHMLEWRLIEQAFPGVPWIFLYRDPVEVMVSHARHHGSQMIPGVVEPAWFGWNWSQVAGLSFEEYGSRVLAQFCEAALDAVQHSQCGHLINYNQLPDVVWDELPSLFGFNLDAAAKKLLQIAGNRNAKEPSVRFVGDGAGKQRDAEPELRAAVEKYVMPLYEQLETWRKST